MVLADPSRLYLVSSTLGTSTISIVYKLIYDEKQVASSAYFIHPFWVDTNPLDTSLLQDSAELMIISSLIRQQSLSAVTVISERSTLVSTINSENLQLYSVHFGRCVIMAEHPDPNDTWFRETQHDAEEGQGCTFELTIPWEDYRDDYC
jgi:hypothetical protein